MNWIRSQADEYAVSAGCYFDESAAERVAEFFRRFLRHSKGKFAGKPFELKDWQYNDIIAPLFGWKRPNKTRRYRRAFVEVPKKNGKSTMAAGVALYMLCADGEQGAEVYSAAADRSQAKIVFNEAFNMVNASPELAKVIRPTAYKNLLEYRKTNSTYTALSSDVPTKDGLNIHALIFDELHTQPNRNLWDVLLYGGIAREQPLLLAITTAGKDVYSMCYEEHVYALKIMSAENGFRDDEYFAYVRAADRDDDIESEETWKKANPSYGGIITHDNMQAAITEVKQKPSMLNTFKRYRLNIWCGAESEWIPQDIWNGCTNADVVIPDGAKCWIGIDLSSTNDICGAVPYFPAQFATIPVFWCLEATIKMRNISKLTPYDLWVQQGYLNEVSGNLIDYDLITAYLEELGKKYDILGLVIDPWNATKYALELQTKGYNVVFCRQGIESLSAPMKELERLIISQKLVHYGNPVLGWMLKNTVAESDSNKNIKPNKKKSKESIDGIVGLIMAIRGSMSEEPESTESVYETRGVYAV